MGIQIPSVVKDHNSKTSIVFKQGRKYIQLISMKSGKLTVTKLTEPQYVKKDYKVLDTPIEDAIAAYLVHSGGYTETAKQALLMLQEGLTEYSVT